MASNMSIANRAIELFQQQADAFNDATSISKLIRHVGCMTGFGGGKSLLLALIGNYWAGKFPGNLIMGAAPTYPQLEKTLWRSFLEITPEGNIVKINRGDMRLILNFSNGQEEDSEIFFYSADMEPERWQGPNLGGILLDEAEGISEAHYKQGKSRLRRVNPTNGLVYPNKMVIATNPPPPDHWFCQDFYYNPKKGYKLHQWSSVDNIHNPQEYVEELLQSYHGPDRQRYVYGKIGLYFTGKIYDYDPELHLIHVDVAEAIRRISPIKVYSIDWGFDDPFVFLELCYWPERKAWIVTREHYASRMSHEEQVKVIGSIWDDRFEIYCDRNPGGANELALRGIPTTDAYKSNNYKEPAIVFINSLLHVRPQTGYPGLYVSTECENTDREFQNWRRKIDKDSGLPIDATYEGADHAMDALIYALYSQHIDTSGELALPDESRSSPTAIPSRVSASRGNEGEAHGIPLRGTADIPEDTEEEDIGDDGDTSSPWDGFSEDNKWSELL